MASFRFDKLVDVVVSLTCFHLNGRGFEHTAVVSPVSTHFAGDHSVSYPGVTADEPQWSVCAAHFFLHTPLRHLDGFSTIEETVPALPLDATVASNLLGAVVCSSPGLVQRGIVIAGVRGLVTVVLAGAFCAIFTLGEGVRQMAAAYQRQIYLAL